MNLKKTILTAAILHLFLTVVAQKKDKDTDKQTEAFGTVSKEILAAKNSEIDKNAEAEVLFETVEQEIALYDFVPEMTIKRHKRIKIYNEKGLDEANFKIRYVHRNGVEQISKFEAQTYNLDGTGNVVVTKLDKKATFDKKINNRFNDFIFTMPEAKAGSVIEIRYTLKTRRFYIPDWYFQENIPVKYSRFSLDYPQEFTINPMFFTIQEYGYDKKTKGLRIIQTVSMKDVQPLKDEPYISSHSDYLQKVQFKLIDFVAHTASGSVKANFTKSWPKIIRDLMEDEDFGIQLKRNIPRTKELDAELKNLQKPVEKMVAVHRYVRKNMTWDGKHDIWAMDGVKTAWSNKKGNSGEINLILINLLKDAGLKAYPLLVSTRDNGRVNTLDADIDQFNTVMAYLEIDNKMYILDATDYITPSHFIPSGVMYSEGLVISQVDFEKTVTEQDWGWVTIWDDKQKYNQKVHVTAEISGDGKMNGTAYVTCLGYARVEGLKDWKQGQEKFVESHYTKPYHGLSVDEFNAKNLDKDSLPLEQNFKFNLPVNSSGEYQYFSINMFCGLDKNPFIADNRVSDIFYGCNQSYTLSGNFRIPDGYLLEAMPQNTKMIMPDTSIVISRISQLDGNHFQYRISLEYLRPVFASDEYPYLVDFHKKLYAMLNEQIVIKKKTTPIP